MTNFKALAATLAAYWNTTTGGRKTRKVLTAELDLAHQRLEGLERNIIAIVHLLIAVERESRVATSAVDMHTRAIQGLCKAMPEAVNDDLELYRDKLALRLKNSKKNGAGHDHS